MDAGDQCLLPDRQSKGGNVIRFLLAQHPHDFGLARAAGVHQRCRTSAQGNRNLNLIDLMTFNVPADGGRHLQKLNNRDSSSEACLKAVPATLSPTVRAEATNEPLIKD
jgi:hypothetical protein